MKASIKTIRRTAAALTLSGLFVALLNAGPYPGQLRDHGHTGPGDGGQLSNFTVTNAVRSSTGVFTQVNIGTTSYPGASTSPLTIYTQSDAQNTRFVGYETNNYADFIFRNATNSRTLAYIESRTFSGDGGPSSVNFWKYQIYASTFSSKPEVEVSTMGVKLKGTTTNDDADAGFYGQYVSSKTGSSGTNAATSTQYSDILSIHLSSGDWDVSGQLRVSRAAATWTGAEIAISTSSGNDAGAFTLSDNWIEANWASATTPTIVPLVLSNVRFSLATAKTIYLKLRCDYSAGTPATRGRISARRAR